MSTQQYSTATLVSRLAYITPIGVAHLGDLADSLADPDVLRCENLDTDLRPHQSAADFTRHAAEVIFS